MKIAVLGTGMVGNTGRVQARARQLHGRGGVDPTLVPGEHHLFLCGREAATRVTVSGWLTQWFGWKPESLIDLGDIKAARAMEMFLPLWIGMMGVIGSPFFNVRVVRGAPPKS